MTDIPTFRQEQRLNHLFLVSIVMLMLAISLGLMFLFRYQPGEDRPWRLAITNWPGFDYLYLAEQKGFLRENDLNIQLIPINGIIDMRSTFERGTIDGYTAPVMDITESVQESGVPARIVLLTDYSNGGDKILADPSITTVAQLRGQRLGLEITSTISSYLLQRALEGTGVSPAELHLIPASQTILVDQTRRGSMDAVITYEPFASQILAARPMHILFDSSRIPDEITDALAVSTAMEKAIPHLSYKLQKAWQSAIDYATAHPDEANAIFAQRYGISVAQYSQLNQEVTILSSAAMQRLANSTTLHQSIMHLSASRHEDRQLSAAEISRTLAVWFQKESR